MRLRLNGDIFFSTRIKIVGCIIALTVATAASYIALLSFVKETILGGFVDALTRALSSGPIDISVFTATNDAVAYATYYVIGAVVTLSIVAGIIVSHLALKPVRQALELQKRFILSVAHELRTPLAVLKTNNEVMLLESDLSEHVRSLLTENIEDVNRLNEIVNNLLLFNRTDVTTPISYTEVDAAALLNKIQGDLSALARSKNITLTLSDDTIPTILGNAVALEQAFFNLTKNAILYTPRGGEVHLGCVRITETTVAIRIADTGAGIPKHDLPHIFEPFFRSEHTEGRARGTGLGLTLVYEIVRLHEGRIEVESVLGKGTAITLSLPRFKTTFLSNPTESHTTLSFDFSTPRDAQKRS